MAMPTCARTTIGGNINPRKFRRVAVLPTAKFISD